MQGEFLIPIFLFGGAAWVLVVYFTNRHKERMAMIEKGVSASDLRGTPMREWLRANPLSSLKWGLLAVFVGIGLFIAEVLDRMYFFHHESIYFATMLVFGGIALIIFYVIANAKMKKEDNKS